MNPLRIGLAQINPTVGDLAGNTEKILTNMARARELAVDLVAFPELVIPGYPPEDLLLKPDFVEANLASLKSIARETRGLTVIVGFVDYDGNDIFNAAALLHDGQVAGVYHKTYLPNYGVFDENRYFRAGRRPLVFDLKGSTVGISICEDIWYPAGPPEAQALAGAQLAVNISASPYHAGKGFARERMLATRAADSVVFVAFCNLVGGQDELVFDGGSVMFDERGELLARARQFEEDLLVADLNLRGVFRQRLHDPRRRKEALHSIEQVERVILADLTPRPPSLRGKGECGSPLLVGEGSGERSEPRVEPRLEAEVFYALVLGTRDYVHKNGFHQVVIGLSGGIDSSLTAAIAVEALGAENVTGVFMPSRYSSTDSREDAGQLAANLGIRFLVIPIDQTFQAYLDMLAEPFSNSEPDVTEENVQARIRGNILMALSNKFGWLVLTTGNKSELATGYCTLYGDMAGGFAVIKDVPKMLVYELAAHVNARAGRQAIPQRVFDKAPTAELRPDQKDEDSLGPYAALDPILRAYVEEDRGLEEIVALGFDADAVRRIIRMVDRAEYKRRQAPPGVKITPRAFGKGRRVPITNRYRE
ncbi:MAG: NAD+ synthase [Chloroflexota bacterium]|nr:NAD+ synthase [Chloroflexota bacterium]